MTRIAILADVHANLPALRGVLDDAESQGCSTIYHAGDLVAIGPYPAEVVGLAMEADVRCVKGNHEEWFYSGLPRIAPPDIDDDELRHHHWTHSRLNVSQREYLACLPYLLDEPFGRVRLRIQHFALDATGRGFTDFAPCRSDEDILTLFGKPNTDLVCFGHIHKRPMDLVLNGCRFLNPGSVGCAHTPIARYAIIEIEGGSIDIIPREVQYDREELLATYDRLEIPAGQTIRRIFFGHG